MKLTDIDPHTLPLYEEHCETIPLAPSQVEPYEQMKKTLMEALKAALSRKDMTLLSVVLVNLLAWPECSFRPTKIIHPRTQKVLFHLPAIFEEHEIAPKEARLIAHCLREKQAGRKVLVYTVYTGKRDTASRLQTLLKNAGLAVTVLRSTVKADQRECWITEQLNQELDVMICHPELVKTGLDLLAFPTIIFMQSGYNVYTLMQAARRSWRIGQTEPVNVYFLGYDNTAQIECLSLMAKKIAVTQSTSGKMPESGLDILNMDDENIEVALAKKLLQA